MTTMTQFQVFIDWAKTGAYGAGTYGSGSYSGVDPDDVVTNLVRPHSSVVSAEYGRDQSTALAPTVAGRGSVVLDNRDKRFSPRNTDSPLYGNLKPARPVTITRTAGSSTYILFVGHTDDNPINPDVSSKTVQISLVDWLADFRAQNISTPLYAGIRTGEAIGYILDAAGWDPALRDLDDGATVIPFWWAEGKDALTALEEVVRSEGPPALLTIGTSGEIVFRDRHHRLMDSASLTSQQTWWGKPGVEPTMQTGFTYDEAWRNIVNSGAISVDVRTPAAVDAVWTLDSPIGFTAGETKTFTAASSDPFMNAVAPVSGTDYTATSGSISSTSLSRTSGASTTITVVAGGGGAQIDRLQLRAQPVQVAYTVQVTDSDAASVADYGTRSFPSDLPWCNQYDAAAVLSSAIEQRAQPNPVVTTRFQATKNAKAALLLPRNMSDRVTIHEEETALDGVDFFIESIGHDVAGPHDHQITFGLEAVPPDGTVTSSNLLILGSSAVGHRLGDGLLAP